LRSHLAGAVRSAQQASATACSSKRRGTSDLRTCSVGRGLYPPSSKTRRVSRAMSCRSLRNSFACDACCIAPGHALYAAVGRDPSASVAVAEPRNEKAHLTEPGLQAARSNRKLCARRRAGRACRRLFLPSSARNASQPPPRRGSSAACHNEGSPQPCEQTPFAELRARSNARPQKRRKASDMTKLSVHALDTWKQPQRQVQ
jgi:hypothetical protein